MQEKYNRLFIEKELIETPALIIDMDLIEENIALTASYYKTVKAKLRPHFKAHKSSFLALRQIEAGAIGMTCAKVGEAEVLVKAGIKDILIANQIVAQTKIERLALLARHARIIVAVDNEDNLKALSQAGVKYKVTIGILVDADVGLGRCGVRTLEEGVGLAKQAISLPGIKFFGIMGYEGHCNIYKDLKKRTEEVGKANNVLTKFKKLLAREDIAVDIVSAGGTAMYDIATLNQDITEIQAGAYILMGTKWTHMEGIPFKQAETILTTVISTPLPDTFIVDAGLKAYSIEAGNPSVKGHSGIEVARIGEEHTTLKSTSKHRFKVGDTIELIPSNCCTTTNLYDFFYGIRDNKLETIIPIDARGRFD